jgi:hypothetical protein
MWLWLTEADLIITLDENLLESCIGPCYWVLRCGGADLESG